MEIKDRPWLKRVEGAVKREYLTIEKGAICYKGVPIWSAVVPLELLDIFLVDPEYFINRGESEPYQLCCIDQYGSVYFSGQWNTLEEALGWLENPRRGGYYGL